MSFFTFYYYHFVLLKLSTPVVCSFADDSQRYIPSFVKRTRIPAISDAPILDPSENPQKRWPVAILSHGLGGTFNTYSYLAGCLASCGLVVFAIEHRDGSAPVSAVRNEDGSVRLVDYKRLSHDPEPEILDARNEQLRFRMTELDLLYSIVEQLEGGKTFTNLATKFAKKKQVDFPVFASKLDLSPSKVAWMGHSFGAATMVQFLKSVYWSRSFPEPAQNSTKASVSYTTAKNGPLARQVTSKSPVVLLDLWTMPLRPERSRWFYEQPLPCFDAKSPTSTTVLSIMSQEFQNYSDLFRRTKYLLSGNPEKSGVNLKETTGKPAQYGPKLFVVKDSAHLSQSDFGLLFPYVTKRFMGAAEPERIINLNARAILQMLRENDIPVRPIKRIEEDAKLGEGAESPDDDNVILKADGKVRSWNTIALEAR